MTVAHIVTGLAYGDESKGSVVDYLSRQGRTLVVRHCGGPQAGHNVVDFDGRHHEFAQFGAGSFAGADTWLSDRMLINPINMTHEGQHLESLGMSDIWAQTMIDSNCRIITPFHVAYNRAAETARGILRHGSCGQGVGAAVWQDIAKPEYTVRACDIWKPNLQARLQDLRRWLLAEADKAGLEPLTPEWTMLTSQIAAGQLGAKLQDWARKVRLVPSDYLYLLISPTHEEPRYDQVVFEGSQGVLLDQVYGWHPYTTWTDTTHRNALNLLDLANFSGTRIRWGVTRTTTPRHGPGPLPTYDADLTALLDEPHNPPGRWQGEFRQGHLDLVTLRYAIQACGGVDRIAVTHLDRGNQWLFCDAYQGATQEIPLEPSVAPREVVAQSLFEAKPVYTEANTEELLAAISEYAPIGLRSTGPTAHDKTLEKP